MEKQARKEKEREKAARAAGRDPKRVRFINNLVLLEAAARGDLDEGAPPTPTDASSLLTSPNSRAANRPACPAPRTRNSNAHVELH